MVGLFGLGWRKVEKEAARFVLKEGWAGITGVGQVDADAAAFGAAEVNTFLPAEVIALVLSVASPELSHGSTEAAVGALTVEEQPVAVSRKVGRKVLGGTIDNRTEVYRRLPAIVKSIAFGDPKVEITEAARSIRCEEEAEAILGDGWVLEAPVRAGLRPPE